MASARLRCPHPTTGRRYYCLQRPGSGRGGKTPGRPPGISHDPASGRRFQSPSRLTTTRSWWLKPGGCDRKRRPTSPVSRGHPARLARPAGRSGWPRSCTPIRDGEVDDKTQSREADLPPSPTNAHALTKMIRVSDVFQLCVSSSATGKFGRADNSGPRRSSLGRFSRPVAGTGPERVGRADRGD